MVNTYDLSVGVFIRGLTNLRTQLVKAEEQAVAAGGTAAALLDARLGARGRLPDGANPAPADLHMYTLANQVHWAVEGSRLAIARLLGSQPVPGANDAKSFVALRQRIDTTIAYLREIPPSDLESGLDRTIVIERPRGTITATGSQFLLAYAIPHFFYHVTTAYGILRNEGIQLTMGDFLGNWGTS